MSMHVKNVNTVKKPMSMHVKDTNTVKKILCLCMCHRYKFICQLPSEGHGNTCNRNKEDGCGR